MICKLAKIAFLTVLTVVGFFADVRSALPAEGATDAIVAEAENAVIDLGSSEYKRRRAAFLELWKLGKDALPAVQAAKLSEDLQIAETAKILEPLLLLEFSVEQLNPELLELMLEPSAEGVATLCAERQWKLALHLLETNPRLLAVFSQSPGRLYLDQIVESALKQGNVDLAWPLVRTAMQNVRVRTSRSPKDLSLFIAHKLDLPLAADQLADQNAQATLLFYDGKPQEAYSTAASVELKRLLITRGGLWNELAKEQVLALFGATRQATPAQKIVRATYLEFAGNFEGADKLWAEAFKTLAASQNIAPEDVTPEVEQQLALALLNKTQSPVREQVLFALILGGRHAAVEKYLETLSPTAAFRFYVAGNQFAKALETLGLRPDLSNFSDWLINRTALIQQEILGARDNTNLFSQTANLCNLLIGLGYHERAKEVLDMLVKVSRYRANLWAGPGSIIGFLGRAEQRVICLATVEAHFPSMKSDDARKRVLWALFPDIRYALEELYRTAPRAVDSDGKPVSSLMLLEHLNLWDTKYIRSVAGPDAVSNWLRTAQENLLAEQAINNNSSTYVRQLEELSEIAVGCGLTDLALEFALQDTRDFGVSKDVLQQHWISAAELLLELGDVQKASDLLEKVRTAPNAYNTQSALVNEVKALLLSSRYAEALALDRSRWLRPLSSERSFGGQSYAAIASDFATREEYSTALEYAEAAFKMANFAGNDIYWTASDLSEVHVELEDYAASADALRSRLVEALTPGSRIVSDLTTRFFHSSLRYEAQKERLHRAVACIEQRNFDQAQRHMQVAERLQPQDIELVVQCYPRLRDAGELQLAEDLLKSFEETMNRHIEQWPTDSTAINNMAWMYSQCNQKLDQALELANQAVKLAPSSAVYLDTLAEVHFRRGNISEALRLMDECLRIDPRDSHYEKNIARYSAGAK